MARRRALERWLEMAREAHAAADNFRDPRSKRTLLDIAESYENLAKWAAGVDVRPQEAEKLADATTGDQAMARAASNAARPGGRRRNSE